MTSRLRTWSFFLLLSGSGGGYTTAASTTSGPPGVTATVDATPNLAFSPSPASILPGGTVTFAFGAVAHNVFFDAVPGAPADIAGNNSGTSVARTFPTAGTYTYNCHIHPGMRGTIVVGTSATTSTSGGSGYR